jgi:ribosome biogenesis GTPase
LRIDEPRRALVLATGKNSAWISVDGESEPRIAQLPRMSGKRFMPVPGDVVSVRPLGDGAALLERIEPRAFSLERRTARGRSKTMAANVDMLVVVTALANPAPRLAILDQLLAFSELQNVAGLLLFTKPDLADPADLERLVGLYRSLQYPAIVVNPKAGENVDAFRAAIRGHRAMLAGNSGVGKSSIFRALGGHAVVGDVSRFGVGRQTTTTARLYRMGEGFLIDSPGVNEFGLGPIAPRDLAACFREMREPSERCRFTDCTHLREPGCGVRAALEDGRIAPSRYASFVRILAEPT